jgi:hypothetical protein
MNSADSNSPSPEFQPESLTAEQELARLADAWDRFYERLGPRMPLPADGTAEEARQ